MDRRQFLSRSSQVALGAAAASAALAQISQAKAAPNDRVVVCVAGVRGRGNGLLHTFASLPQVDVKYVCDLDESVLGSRTEQITKVIGRKPHMIKDFRQALDDKQVDALMLGTPDHWHAIPTIMACQAGKDVYVEKPDGHNAIEGKTMVEVAKRHGRVVQLGTQARSGLHVASLLDYLQKGNIGKAVFAKAWESSRQANIGHPADSSPPPGVDYDFWLGPAPARPFNRNRFHSHWRWFFDYGTGDLGNDGVHRLDLARMALQAATEGRGEKPLGFPKTITAVGGKYYFDDAQEWPDTLMVNYDFGGRMLTYEMRIWSAYPMEGEPEGAGVFGDEGYVIIGNGRWRALDRRGKLVREEQASYNDRGHAQNFIDCMHTRAKPAADLETVGHPSSLLCHLGNCAWRAGRTLTFDRETYTFVGDEDANQYLTRPEYRKPWVLEDIAKA
jgi:predicted dehydrogenase